MHALVDPFTCHCGFPLELELIELGARQSDHSRKGSSDSNQNVEDYVKFCAFNPHELSSFAHFTFLFGHLDGAEAHRLTSRVATLLLFDVLDETLLLFVLVSERRHSHLAIIKEPIKRLRDPVYVLDLGQT